MQTLGTVLATCVVLLVTLTCARADLTHYWPFDTGYADTVGGASSAAVGTGVSLATTAGEYARGAGGLRINSSPTSVGYVDVTQSCIPNGQQQVTVTAWYRYADIGGDGSDSRKYVWSTAPDYSCEFSVGTAHDGEWWFRVLSGTAVNDIDGPVVNDNLWHHVALLWDRTANRARYYHDGVLRDDRDTASVPGDLSNSTGLHIGDYRVGDGARNWDGYIDDVALFHHALSDADVRNLFHGASPRNLGNPPVRAARVTIAPAAGTPTYTVVNQSPGFSVNFLNANAGDHELYSGDSRLLQTHGLIMGSANDGADSVLCVAGDLTYTGGPDTRYDNGMGFPAFDLSGHAEKNFNTAFAFFPFAWEGEGWIGAHVDPNGTVLAGPHLPAGTTVAKLAPVAGWRNAGHYVVRIPNVDARLNGMLFVTGGDNTTVGNYVSAGVLQHADDVNVVRGEATLGSWHIQVRTTAQDDTSDAGVDGSFSFLYLPYNTVNLVGGRLRGDGAVLKGTGGFTATDGTGAGQVDIRIPNGQGGYRSDQDGILLLTDCAVLGDINSGNNQDPVSGNALSWVYDGPGQKFVVSGFDAPGGTAEDTDFVFAFVPFAQSLLPPSPTQGTLFIIR